MLSKLFYFLITSVVRRLLGLVLLFFFFLMETDLYRRWLSAKKVMTHRAFERKPLSCPTST